MSQDNLENVDLSKVEVNTLKETLRIQENYNKSILEDIKNKKDFFKNVILVYAFFSTLILANFNIYVNKFSQLTFIIPNILNLSHRLFFIDIGIILATLIIYGISFFRAYLFSIYKTEKGKLTELGFQTAKETIENLKMSEKESLHSSIIKFQRIIKDNLEIKDKINNQQFESLLEIGITLFFLVLTSCYLIIVEIWSSHLITILIIVVVVLTTILITWYKMKKS